jgi:2-succinyl-5-enolpyruvyl-6-hydroxy-3-cyclohexene-1-carboxylate synthase
MIVDFRNTNTLWSSILVETLYRLGLTTAIVCPGSRSTPITFAFAQHPHIEAIPILDERSAAFFALGIAKRIQLPVALICTSGSAAANFYPAIIEAKESHIPLLIITADRPPELRHCHAGQTIDQLKLYGNYPNWQIELATPSTNFTMLAYLRQNLVRAWEKALFPNRGPVHLNLPLREPLAPLCEPQVQNLEAIFPRDDFFNHLTPLNPFLVPSAIDERFVEEWRSRERGIIIGGLAQPDRPLEYCQAIAKLSQILAFPVLAEALSPLRNYAKINPYLISTYDFLLRDGDRAERFAPDLVIQIGELPTSKELRLWLEKINPQRWIIDPSGDNLDPLHGRSIHLCSKIENFHSNYPYKQSSDYLQEWLLGQKKMEIAIAEEMNSTENICEAKVAWLLSQNLGTNTSIFIANSMSVRYAEFFWVLNNRKLVPYFSRGTNGIDGTLSTALGIAHQSTPTVLLTGDLALLHDTNGFLLQGKFQGYLTIVLINNNGGGIFEMLPISEFNPPFEEYFATPQNIDFQKLSATYGIDYHLINSWEHLQKELSNVGDRRLKILEIKTNRKLDPLWWKFFLNKILLHK